MADSKERVNEPCKVIESKLTIKFGFLENFNLSDEHIVERVDGLTCLLYVSAKCIWDSANGKQQFNKILQTLAPTLSQNLHTLQEHQRDAL